MLRIKLQPFGKKHAHTYRVVVAEDRSKLTGMPRDTLGSVNPAAKTQSLDQAKLKSWLAKGAQPTAAIRRLFSL